MFNLGFSQNPGFIVPDTICVNTNVPLVCNISNATTYYWNFCSASLGSVPTGTNLGNPLTPQNFDLPVYSQLIKQGNDHFLFMCSANSSGSGHGNIFRYYLGNAFSNWPISFTAMPNTLLHWNAECLRIIKDDVGNYYGYLTNGLDSTILRFEFGSDIWNTPTVTNLGNLGNLVMPHGLEIVQDNGNWIGFVTNSYSNTITRLDWGNSIANIPTGTNLGNIGSLNAPKALSIIKDDSQNWYVFVNNYNTSSITRLSFGSSLTNIPVGYNTGYLSGVNGPEGLTILKDCDKYFGYVANYASGSNSLCRISFPNGLNGNISGVNIGNLGFLYRPGHFSNIYRENDTLFMYLSSRANSTSYGNINRLKFLNCTSSSIASSTLQTPPPFTYSVPGTYNISLIIDEGLPTQQIYCHDIVVVNSSYLSIGANQIHCIGDTVTLQANAQFSSYLWSTGATTPTIEVTTSGTYWLQVNTGAGCAGYDNVYVSFLAAVQANLGPNTMICPGVSTTLSPTLPFTSYLWSTGSTQPTISTNQLGTYWVSVTDNHGCHSTDTIQVLKDPGYVTNVNKSICPGTGYFVGGQFQTTAGTYYDTLQAINLCDSVIITNLSFYAPFSLNLASNASFCAGTSVSLNAYSGNYTYHWSNGMNGAIIVVNQPGYYYVTATSDQNCTAKDTIFVTMNPLPQVYLGNDTILCVGQTLNLSPGNGYVSYLWNTGNAASSIPVNATGYYWVSVTDALGCHNKDTVFVNVMPEPVINLGNDTILCIGLSVLLNPGSAFSSYFWNTGDTMQILNVTQSGKYMVIVTYGPQCYAKDSVEVNFVLGNIFDLGPDTSFCNGQSTVLNPGSGFSSYLWNNGSTLPVQIVNQSGYYEVSITRSDGCFDQDSIQVTVFPTPVITLLPSICQGDSLLAGGEYQHVSGIYYDSLLTLHLCDSVIITNLIVKPTYLTQLNASICSYDSVFVAGQYQHQAGIYYDTLQSNQLCDSVIKTSLFVLPAPDLFLTPDTFYCRGDFVVLNAMNAGAQYLWNNGMVTQTIQVGSPGAYIVTITNTNGCKGIDTTIVAEQSLPVIIHLPITPKLCIDSSIVISCIGTYSYQWDPMTGLTVLSDSSVLASPQHSTLYNLIATDNLGCSSDTAVQVTVYFHPESILTDTISACLGLPVILDPGNSGNLLIYKWSTGDSSRTITAGEPGLFWVNLSNGYCELTDSVFIKECKELIIPNVITPNGDGRNETFHVEGDFVPGFEMYIYNRWGKLIFQTDDFYEGWDGKNNGQTSSDGTYYYIVYYSGLNYAITNVKVRKSGSVTLLR